MVSKKASLLLNIIKFYSIPKIQTIKAKGHALVYTHQRSG